DWNTTAVIGYDSTTQTWGVVQRYVYSPYGNITVLNSDWSTPAAGTQPLVDNLYQGMTLDAVTGLYYDRFRDYSPSLGRWMEQDPAQYINGANTYQFVDSSPVGNVDGAGLAGWGAPPWGAMYTPPPDSNGAPTPNINGIRAVARAVGHNGPELSAGDSEYAGFGGGIEVTLKPVAVKGGTDYEVTVNLHWGIGIGGDAELGTHKIALEVKGPSVENVFKLKVFVPCGKTKWAGTVSDSQRINDSFSGSASLFIGVEGSFGAFGELQEKFTLSGTHPLVLDSVIQFVGKIHAGAAILLGPIHEPFAFNLRGTYPVLRGNITLMK
ncbi:MAG: RHS repeat-associated core domain-containing protein, partial [Phycisphaerae bacterium]